MLERARAELRSTFGFPDFRGLQWPVIEHVLSGGDAVVLMPTGGGKSLCYQLPALLLPGVCVVVSPLIALMRDQVQALRQMGVRAACINSALAPG
ncbi:DEAD/DEAH box helicase, partial [Desulfocurvus sp.]|uniref:DEAD/DEAH box helicase n=1 Tax=Desulfocurvus sp. TaxID=2871698 RepID=UPI0025BD4C5C